MKKIAVVGMIIALLLPALVLSAQADRHGMQPFLGIRFDAADEGVLVVALVPDGPAAAAGVLEGDVITAVNDEAVTADNAINVLSAYSPDDTVTLTLLRDGESQTVDVILGTAPARGVRGEMIRPAARPMLGITVDTTDDGLLIQSVMPASPAEDAGLLEGDIINAVNGTSVDSLDALRDALTGGTIILDITRDGESLTVEANLPEMAEGGFFVHPEFGGHGFGFMIEDGKITIGELPEGSSLYEAGLREGDAITAVNGEALDMSNMMPGMMPEGDTLTLTVERDGETLEIEIPAGMLFEIMMPGGGMPFDFHFFGEDGEGMPHGMPFAMPVNGAYLGVRFVTLDETTAAEHEVSLTEGAYVAEVVEGSPASEAGLQAGDIITAVDGDIVDVERTLADRIHAYEPGDAVVLDVLRGEETLQITVTLGEPKQSGFFHEMPMPVPPMPEPRQG